jgi:EmrB/QacA subfamily drug resistance transporter
MKECLIQEKIKQNWLIAIVSAAVFMFSVDYSMVNISLPAIAVHFKAAIGHVSRIPLAYLLVVTSTVLFFGKLGDIIGFKKIFIAGIGIFLTGTFLCGVAPTLNTLLAFRIYQCIGEAMFSPIAIALVTVFLPPGIKGKALGFMATAQGLGFCIGPILGGFLNDHLGWHSIFFVNIPLGLATIITALKMLPPKQHIPAERRIDVTGSVLIFISLSTLVFALNFISEMGLKHPVIISCLAASAVAFILFLMQERAAKNPILHLSLFKNRDFAFATASAFCVIFVYIGLMFLFPFYLNIVRGIDMMHSGLFLMAPAFMVIISSPIAGLISDKFGSRAICTFGVSLTTLAFFLFSLLRPDTPLLHIMPSLIMAGIAIGCFLPANNKLVMAHAPADKQGMAAAVYKILNSTGGVFGIAILPMVLMRRALEQAAVAHIDRSMLRDRPDILMTGFDAAFKFGMFICLLGLLFTVLARDKKEKD